MNCLWMLLIFTISTQDSTDYFAKRGLETSYVENYDSAGYYIKKVIEREPENPLGYFLYTGLFRLYVSDFVTDSFIDSFYHYADKTIKIAEKRIQRNENDSWSHFFIGASNMYLSSFYVERGNYLKALGFAERAVEEMELCLQVDPTIYDAYLVKGSYEYIKGSFPLWGGYKERGIKKIRKASRRSKYSKIMAKNILAILLKREGRYEESIQEAKELVEIYPNSRTFRWILCKAYLAKGDWNSAIKNYRQLIENIEEEQPSNSYNIIQAKLHLATAYYNIGNYRRVIEVCNDIFSVDDGKKKTEDMVQEARELCKNAKERL
jgi:tetratricopeptide (TPR) repeat protein